MAEQITSAKATAKTVRTSPRKARLVIDLIRGKSVAEAISILKFTPNKSAGIIEKVMMSAVANAENNFDLDVENLVVSEAFVNPGLVQQSNGGPGAHRDESYARIDDVQIGYRQGI